MPYYLKVNDKDDKNHGLYYTTRGGYKPGIVSAHKFHDLKQVESMQLKNEEIITV